MEVNRNHFSWSQYDLWHRSKREYWKRYHLGAEEKSNRFFDKGKELAIFLESGKDTNQVDPMLKLIADELPRYDSPEHELRYGHYVGSTSKEVLCYVDSLDSKTKSFIEYKTGKIPWDKKRVEEAEQLLFYAQAIFQIHDVIPRATLVWVETMQTEDDGLLYTGKVKKFGRSFEMLEVQTMMIKIANTIEEIERFEYQELELDEDDVKRYAHLLEVINQAQDELSQIKMKVQAEMMKKNVKFGKGGAGNFIISERKVWKYSEIVDELKKDIKYQQDLEKKNGSAVATVNQSIMFKLNK